MVNNSEIHKMKKDQLKYAIGALMYCPGDNLTIGPNLVSGKLGYINTLVLCLEDAIMPQNLDKATDILENTFRYLRAEKKKNEDTLPLIFVRVRGPQHLEDTYKRFRDYSDLIDGFVLPKYDTSNSTHYMRIINRINICHKFWYLPILESESVVFGNRAKELHEIRQTLDGENQILGILVGSNDMCRLFGIRRNAKQNVYDIGVVRDTLADIMKEFGTHYVVNGPVWEFFDGEEWEKGLRKEVELDKLNGFIGKACIHPRQVAVVQDALRVDKFDYEDACDLVNWNIESGVKKSQHSGRMNEVATNLSWAEKTKTLGDIYGIAE